MSTDFFLSNFTLFKNCLLSKYTRFLAITRGQLRNLENL